MISVPLFTFLISLVLALVFGLCLAINVCLNYRVKLKKHKLKQHDLRKRAVKSFGQPNVQESDLVYARVVLKNPTPPSEESEDGYDQLRFSDQSLALTFRTDEEAQGPVGDWRERYLLEYQEHPPSIQESLNLRRFYETYGNQIEGEESIAIEVCLQNMRNHVLKLRRRRKELQDKMTDEEREVELVIQRSLAGIEGSSASSGTKSSTASGTRSSGSNDVPEEEK